MDSELRNLKYEGKLRQLQTTAGIQPLKPLFDMVVRWTSTYAMIERYMELRHTFPKLSSMVKMLRN